MGILEVGVGWLGTRRAQGQEPRVWTLRGQRGEDCPQGHQRVGWRVSQGGRGCGPRALLSTGMCLPSKAAESTKFSISSAPGLVHLLFLLLNISSLCLECKLLLESHVLFEQTLMSYINPNGYIS